MRGQVLGVNVKTGEGQVAGDDGRRYTFRPDDWAHRGEPSVGAMIDFEASDSRATNIFPLPTAAHPVQPLPHPHPYRRPHPGRTRGDRSRWVAALLAFFLGSLGIHRFYTGRTGSGVVMLILSITVVGLAITIPWSWIDTIRYVTMGEREFDDRYTALPAPR